MKTYILPFPPSVNTYWRHYAQPLKGGKHMVKVLISKRGRDFRHQVEDSIGEEEPLTGKLRVNMDLFLPDRRQRDVDNYSKAVLDALTHCRVWKDDSQIYQLHITKWDMDGLHPSVGESGTVRVTIEEYAAIPTQQGLGM